MRNRILYLLMFCLAILIQACENDIPEVSLGLEDVYRIERMQKLPLRPSLTGSEYRWTIDGRVVSTQKDYVFVAPEPRRYHVTFEIIDANNPYIHDFEVIVVEEEVAYSPYISEVVEYFPAPGQFINTMPEYTEGDTYRDMLDKCTEAIRGTNDGLVSLGAYGGYLTFKFDHTVMNVKGEKDFSILGNAFYEAAPGDRKGGSAEPGIVMVSFDANCNGLPDDPWYELRGSEYDNPLTLHGYTITYTRPEVFVNDAQDIPWTDSQNQSGILPKNPFHQQSYWPLWVNEPQLQFTGSCLPPNASTVTSTGQKSILYCYDWGYVDNHPNDQADLNKFDIGNAVDSFGNSVYLPGADFIRVYTGVNQYCGVIGETSTEVSRACDLHISSY